jgi:hypothetical protein
MAAFVAAIPDSLILHAVFAVAAETGSASLDLLLQSNHRIHVVLLRSGAHLRAAFAVITTTGEILDDGIIMLPFTMRPFLVQSINILWLSLRACQGNAVVARMMLYPLFPIWPGIASDPRSAASEQLESTITGASRQ